MPVIPLGSCRPSFLFCPWFLAYVSPVWLTHTLRWIKYTDFLEWAWNWSALCLLWLVYTFFPLPILRQFAVTLASQARLIHVVLYVPLSAGIGATFLVLSALSLLCGWWGLFMVEVRGQLWELVPSFLQELNSVCQAWWQVLSAFVNPHQIHWYLKCILFKPCVILAYTL